MPEVEYTTTIQRTPEQVWEFVKDMGNWAPFLTGYQKHEVLSDTDSVWTLKGDVGMLSRVVRFKAHVTEWAGPSRVSFTLEGLNEVMEGGGTLEMSQLVAGAAEPAKKKIGLFRRFLNFVFRFFYQLMNGKVTRPSAAPAVAGRAASRLQFRLRMDAGGPMGPMVNAMLGPALLPAAEDLANKIAAHLHQTDSAK